MFDKNIKKVITILIFPTLTIGIMVIVYFIFVYLSVYLFFIFELSQLIRISFWLDDNIRFIIVLINIIYFVILFLYVGYLKYKRHWELFWLICLVIFSFLTWFLFFYFILKNILQ